jgi:hypothetical protein
VPPLVAEGFAGWHDAGMGVLNVDGMRAESDYSEATGQDTVVITDKDHPWIRAEFVYVDNPFGTLKSVSVELVIDATWDEETDISTYDLREGFPWAKWEAAARTLATDDMYPQPKSVGPPTLPPPGPARYIVVESEYLLNRTLGLRDPAARIARKYGVNPSTVRTWIRRARKGRLPPSTEGSPVEPQPKERNAKQKQTRSRGLGRRARRS